MNRKTLLVAAIVVTSSLSLLSTDAQARGRRHCSQHASHGSNGGYASHGSNGGYASHGSTGGYAVQASVPYESYTTGYRTYPGHRYQSQVRYSGHPVHHNEYGYRYGNSYYGHPTRHGLSLGSRGYGGFGY